MRTYTTFLLVSAAVLGAGACVARADDCANIAVNNPAFSSPTPADTRPCPVPAEKPRSPTVSDKSASTNPDTQRTGSKTKTASAKPVSDPDQVTVTNTPTGTLLKSGDTTVCISGSVTVVMAAGSGHRVPQPKLNDHSSEPACN
jgi:hypothetical protein